MIAWLTLGDFISHDVHTKEHVIQFNLKNLPNFLFSGRLNLSGVS
jgi:hypothetical protein